MVEYSCDLHVCKCTLQSKDISSCSRDQLNSEVAKLRDQIATLESRLVYAQNCTACNGYLYMYVMCTIIVVIIIIIMCSSIIILHGRDIH